MYKEKVVIYIDKKLYRDRVEGKYDGQYIILPKLLNNQYYSAGFFERMNGCQCTIKWDDLPWVPEKYKKWWFRWVSMFYRILNYLLKILKLINNI